MRQGRNEKMAGASREAVEILRESERPLTYLSTLVGLFVLATGTASGVLVYSGLALVLSIVLGLIVSAVAFLAFFLLIALKRSSAARTGWAASKQELESATRQLAEVTTNATEAEKRHTVAEDELRRQLTESQTLLKNSQHQLNEERSRVEGQFKEEKASLSQQLNNERRQRGLVEAQLQEAYRAIEAERQSTERAKFAPVIDPYFRTQTLLFPTRKLSFVGAWNRGRGAAEDVLFDVVFSSATETWGLADKPFYSVIQVGKNAEFQLNSEHFARRPSRMEVIITFSDVFGQAKSKSIAYVF